MSRKLEIMLVVVAGTVLRGVGGCEHGQATLQVAPGKVAPLHMSAFVANNDMTSSFHDWTQAVPAIGQLHNDFSPLPSSCEYLVQVHSSSINPSDIHPTVAHYPHVLGSDMAGEVVAVGCGCASFSLGDRVWGDIGANTQAKDNGAKTKELGAYAEYALALETQLAIIPSNIGFGEAAALAKVGLTSYKALVWYSDALNNTALWDHAPTVLVLGGSGGTGTTGIQLAKAFGAGAIITTTSGSNTAYVQQLGATQVIDYTQENWWEVLKEDSVDVVYDTVGQTGTADRAMGVLRGKGSYFVTIAGSLSSDPKPGVKQSFFINSDTNLANTKELDALSALMAASKLRMPRIDSQYTLASIPAAFNASRTGHTVGKLVVNVTVA